MDIQGVSTDVSVLAIIDSNGSRVYLMFRYLINNYYSVNKRNYVHLR